MKKNVLLELLYWCYVTRVTSQKRVIFVTFPIRKFSFPSTTRGWRTYRKRVRCCRRNENFLIGTYFSLNNFQMVLEISVTLEHSLEDAVERWREWCTKKYYDKMQDFCCFETIFLFKFLQQKLRISFALATHQHRKTRRRRSEHTSSTFQQATCHHKSSAR